MYEYVPTNLAASPPIVVAAHYCGGSASAFFGFTGVPAVVAAADRYGFIMIFPQTTNPATSAKCWDVGSKASLTHEGGGDTQAIAQMVKYEITTRNADAGRVYVMGASSGAMLTEAMLAVYPDVFKAGAEFSGVPAGCWSAGWSAASNWGGTCANGQDVMTAQQWGDLVRGMYPGYSGYRPRIQLWHGTADTTINYNNQTEAIKEWTNVLGLSTAPSSTDSTSVAGFTIQKWQSSCPFTVLEAHTQANGGHTTPIDANSVISFFGLDKTGPDPQVAACGSTGNGGSSGSGGRTGSDAGSGNGGAPGGSGGRSGSGGAAGATGGGSGGRLDAGTPGTGGLIMPGTGGQVVVAGTGGSGTGAPTQGDGAGCSCAVAGGRGSAGALAALTLAAFGMAFGRRARRRR
jgi:poly(hydroxyalkanoate) depolymerase family esterase